MDGMILTLIREQDPRVDYLLDHEFPFVLYGRTRESCPYAFVDMDGKKPLKKHAFIFQVWDIGELL